MASIQSRHLNPIDGMYSKPLLRTGVEDAVMDRLGSDWVIRCPYDKVTIKKIDQQKKIVTFSNNQIVTYSDKNLRNSSAGFYHLHSYSLDQTLKVGSKMNKGDPIAYNDGVIKDGTLAITGRYLNVCLVPQADLMEDAALVSSRVANEMVMKYIFDKEVVINPSEKLKSIVNIGDMVNVGDSLMEMEPRIDDVDLIDSPLFNELDDIGNKVISKVKGEVVDIKFYSNRTELNKVEKQLVNTLNKIPVDSHDTTSAKVFLTNDQRLLGRKLMDSIIIHIFIRTDKPGSSGSKITMQSTKAVYRVKDSALMPRTVKDNLEIDVQISSLSLITRMVPSNIINGYLSKIVHRVTERLKNENNISKIRSELVTLVSTLYRGSEYKDILQSELARINTYNEATLKRMLKDDDFFIIVKPFREPSLRRIEETASIMNVPLEEKVYFPDKNNMVAKEPTPVLYIPIKFLNQIADKGVSQSHKVDEINSETGQLTQTAKTRQLSVDESLNLFSYGVHETVLPELTLFRSDDREAFNSMEREIVENGTVSISDISSQGQAHTANTLGAYLLAAGYDNNVRQDVNIKVDKKSVDIRS